MNSIRGRLFKLFLRYQRITHPPKKEFNLAAERNEMEETARIFKPLGEFKCEPVNVNGVPAEWLTPPQVDNGRIILYLHGGYFMMGSINSHRNLAGNIAIFAKARTLIIDYRLAPEHPFPAGLEDALTAYNWLLAQGISADHIYLAGDSAGGGLVISILLALRDRNAPLPAGGVCLSPYTDLTLGGDSWKTNAKKELLVTELMAKKSVTLYLGDHDTRDPLASPLFGDLHGLPPLLIQVGGDEVLLSHSTSLAVNAKNAGVDVKLEVWPGMFHVFQYTASMLPEGRWAIEKIAAFIQSVSEKNR